MCFYVLVYETLVIQLKAVFVLKLELSMLPVCYFTICLEHMLRFPLDRFENFCFCFIVC